jgi:DnaK suppressor protein
MKTIRFLQPACNHGHVRKPQRQCLRAYGSLSGRSAFLFYYESVELMRKTQLRRVNLDEITQKLRDRQKTVLEEVRDEFDQRDNQHLVKLMGSEPGDSGDVSLADAVADLNILRADRQINELRDIEAAFERLKKGDFGICVDCGADIPVQRLLAYPAAKRCMACQKRHEQLFVQEGRPKL